MKAFKIMMSIGLSSGLIGCATTTPKPAPPDPAVLEAARDNAPLQDASWVNPKISSQSEDCLEASQCANVTSEIDPTVSIADVKKVYPKLEYGTPQPFVCAKPILPKGKLENRPNLQVMWEYYIPKPPERVWEEVGGVVEINGCLPENKGGWMNACTVRLSHMLNNAGHKLPRVRGQTVSGGTGNQYFFRLNEMRAYLKKAFGPADVELLDMSGKFIDMPELPGLLLMKFPGGGYTGHATLWNGAGLVEGGGVAAYEIHFWELPCYEPVDRIYAKTRS